MKFTNPNQIPPLILYKKSQKAQGKFNNTAHLLTISFFITFF